MVGTKSPENLPPDRYKLMPYTGPSLPSPTACLSSAGDTGRPSNHPESTPSSSKTPDTSLHSHSSSSKTSPLSNYLSPMTPTAPRIKTGKARVLTSSECLACLEEKERKKKAEVEEKERRKQDREAKRKQKEEEKRQKAQEKAKKAEERVKKAEEKARMATARATSKKAATSRKLQHQESCNNKGSYNQSNKEKD